jgi:hypothetical protein
MRFPYLGNETYQSTNGTLTHTLPRLNRKYTTVDVISDNYEPKRVNISKTVRILPLVLDIISFPVTFGIPVLVDVFKSDFYKISGVSKTNEITLVNTQAFMSNQFDKIRKTKNADLVDRFVDDYPFYNGIQLAINLRDSLEFKDAIDSYKEQSITNFIQKRSTSIYLAKASKIESDFKKSRIEFVNVKAKNTVEGYENFIKEFPYAIQSAEAHKALVDVSEKEALSSFNSSKMIIYYNNYLTPNRNYLSEIDFREKKSKINSQILKTIEIELTNKDYAGIKSHYSNFNSLDKMNIGASEMNAYTGIIQKMLSIILLPDLAKFKSNQDQITFENKIQSDFHNLYLNTNIIVNVLVNNPNKNGKILIFNTDYLSTEFGKGAKNAKYKNIPSYTFEYGGRDINFTNNPTSQVLSFKQNFLDGVQENYFKGEYSSKISFKDLMIINEGFYLNNKQIGNNYYDPFGKFIYKYEFENGINLTIKKFEENIRENDNLISGKKLDQALAGYKNLLNNNYPKDLKQNLDLVKKIDYCKNLIQKKEQEEQRIRIAEEKRQDKIRIAEEKRLEKERLANERSQSRRSNQNNYSSSSSPDISGIYKMSGEDVINGVHTYVMFNSKGVFIIAMGSSPNCLVDINSWVKDGSYTMSGSRIYLSHGKVWEYDGVSIIAGELRFYYERGL